MASGRVGPMMGILTAVHRHGRASPRTYTGMRQVPTRVPPEPV